MRCCYEEGVVCVRVLVYGCAYNAPAILPWSLETLLYSRRAVAALTKKERNARRDVMLLQ